MATVTSTPTAGSLSVRGTTQKSGMITWSKPTVPSGVTITSCVLTGTATASMSKGSATITVNGTTVTAGSQFTINLGTSNNTTSVTTTAKGGNKNAAGTVSFSNLVYTVTYTEPVSAQKNTYIFDANEDCGYVVANGQTYRGKSVRVEVGLNEELSFTIYPNSGYIISSVNIGGINHDWNSESPYSTSVDGNGNYFGETTISIVYTEKVEEILLNTVIINSNENWGYVKNLTTNEIYTGTNITVTGPNTEDIDLMIYPNEGYHIASIYEDKFGEDVGPFTQYPCGLAASVGSNIQTYTYVVTYAKNEEPETPSGITIAKYTFNSNIDTLPTFNSGFIYTYTDVNNGDGTITRTITSDSGPSSISFGDKTGLVSLSYLDTSKVTDMSYMLWGCQSLTTLDLSNFDTSDVTNMKYMFYNCVTLTELDVSSFDTNNVTNMSYMFHSCNSLTSLDVSNFDTSNVTDMSYMFGSDWDDGSSLQSIDISNFNMENVTDNTDMFNNCYYLNKVILNDITTASKIIPHLPNKNEYDYVAGTLVCNDINPSLIDTKTLQAKNWNIVSDIKIAEYTFNSSTDTLPTFNEGFTYEYTDVDNGNNTKTRTITSETLPSSISFYNKTGLISVSYLNTSNVISMREMFDSCTNLSSLDLNNFDTSNVTNMYAMFYNCNNLTSLDLSNFDTSNVIYMDSMFEECVKLTTLDLSSFNTSKVTTMHNMFANCNKLTTLDLSGWNTSKVTNMNAMFDNCNNLIKIRMKNNNIDTINKIIDALPTRTEYGVVNLMGNKKVSGTNYNAAKEKYWKVYYRDSDRPFIKNLRNRNTKARSNNKNVTRH